MTVQQFCESLYGKAIYAAKTLDINPLIVLSQWALETNWGNSESYIKGHNLAGTETTQGNLGVYPNLSVGIHQYVSDMLNDCPNIRDHQANPTSTVDEVFFSNDYNPSPTYPTRIQAILTDNVEPWWRDSSAPVNTKTFHGSFGTVTVSWQFEKAPYHFDVTLEQ